MIEASWAEQVQAARNPDVCPLRRGLDGTWLRPAPRMAGCHPHLPEVAAGKCGSCHARSFLATRTPG